jgi:hypothetical protein
MKLQYKEAPMDIQIGDVVQMRKTHPCGSDRWQVYRMGADVGIRCLGCQRRVMMPRSKFERGVKRIVPNEGA